MREERIGNTIYLKLDFESDWFSQALSRLYEFHIGSIVVEGGSKLLHYLIEHHLWDEAIVFYSKSHLQEGIVAPSIKGRVIQQCNLEQVQMIQYLQA
jgi:diaminohydroxyphosphoribosylaminopyrimidine deaminase/5-amino-6-(5-phosphoribosylamino)uracil reductase